MNNVVWVLAKRELSAFFFTPMAYVFVAVFLVFSGVVFAADIFVPGREAQMRVLFDWQAFLLVFMLPMFTARLLADEFKSGTIEMLMTAPVKDWEVILGKFLGAWLFYLAMLVPTVLYAFMLRYYGDADIGQIAAGYLGLILLGALCISLGTLTSSMTRHQVVAGIMALLVLSVFTFLLVGITRRLTGTWQNVARSLNVYERFTGFSTGLIDLESVVFFLSATVGILFVAVKVLESRRWR